MGLESFNLFLYVSKKQTANPQDVFVFISHGEKDPSPILQEHPYLRRISKKIVIITNDDHPTHHNLVINENSTKTLPINFQDILMTEEDFCYIGMINGGVDECQHKLYLKLICSQSCSACARIEGHFCQSEIKLTNMYI